MCVGTSLRVLYIGPLVRAGTGGFLQQHKANSKCSLRLKGGAIAGDIAKKQCSDTTKV
jgi:hypothetical protein